jgi:tetratricopeptide (TPR) repeat protein
MLWSADPWFTATLREAQEAKLRGDAKRAEKLCRALYERALEAGEPGTVKKARCEWISFLGYACRYEEAKLESERFLAELKDPLDRLIRIEVEYFLANFLYYLNEYDYAIDLAQKALSSFDEKENPSLRARVFNMLALAERHIGLYEQAIEHFHEAVLILRMHNLSDDGGYDGNLALLYEDRGRYRDALESYQVCLVKAKAARSEEMITFAVMGIGTICQMLGRFKEASSFLSDALAKAENMENTLLTQNVHVALARFWLEKGDAVTAFDHATAALLMAQESAIPELEADARVIFGHALLGRKKKGDLDEALANARSAAKAYTQLGLGFGVAEALDLEAEVLLEQGLGEDASKKALDAVDLGEEYGEDLDRIYFTAARALLSAGRGAEAQGFLEKARRVIHEKAEPLEPGDRETFLARPLNKYIINPPEKVTE